MNKFSASQFRQQFPILQTVSDAHQLVYFDNAATTQKFDAVINSSQHFYLNSNANVHRASHFLSAKATKAYETVRIQVKDLLNAHSEKEIIWTKGSTEAINLVAQSYGMQQLKLGDEIVLSQAEHHANIVPWQHVAEQTGAKIKVLPLDAEGRIDLTVAKIMINENCRFLAINHISNVLGKINPVAELIALAKAQGATTLIDGAQAIAHLNVDVQQLDCDFYVFSAHKMYGPTGIGVLYGKQQLLTQMPPYQFGGEMIKKVSFSGTCFNELPQKFEAGTPNIVGVVGFGACLDLFSGNGFKQLLSYEDQLCAYLYNALAKMPEVEFFVSAAPDIPLFTFRLKNVHHHDLATYLDSKGIAARAGHHCAMPLMSYLGVEGAVRVSLTAYNTITEIDYFIAQLQAYGQQNLGVEKAVSNSEFLSKQQILALFAKANSWDLKHRQIMLLAKQLPRIAKNLRSDKDLISGCESKAWLVLNKPVDSPLVYFQADSDAKVIRGLLVIILSVYQAKTIQQIIDVDIEQYFETLGLIQHLSPSRGNGVRAIVQRITELAASYL